MAIVGDPVAGGIVTSLAQPGGNITGQSFFNPELGAKKIELLKEALPHMTRAACLLNQDNPGSTVLTLPAMEVAAKSLKMELYQFGVRRPDDLEGAFRTLLRNTARCHRGTVSPLLNTAGPCRVNVRAARKKLKR